MLTSEQKAIVRATWRLLVPVAVTFSALVLARFREISPTYGRLIREDNSDLAQRFFEFWGFVVGSLGWPEASWREEVPESNDLLIVLLALGRRHARLYRVPKEAYDDFGQAFEWALDFGLGQALTPRAASAWKALFELVRRTMIMAAETEVSGLHGEAAMAGKSEQEGLDEWISGLAD